MGKRWLSLLLVCGLVFSTAACGAPKDAESGSGEVSASEPEDSEAIPEESFDESIPEEEADLEEEEFFEEEEPEADLSQIIVEEMPDVSDCPEGTLEAPAQFGQWVQVTLKLEIRNEDGSYERGYTPIYYRITGLSEPLTAEEMDGCIQQVIINDESEDYVTYMQEWREPEEGKTARRIDYEAYIPRTEFQADYGYYYDNAIFSVDANGEFVSLQESICVSPRDAIYDEMGESYSHGGCVIRLSNVGIFEEDENASDHAKYLMINWFESPAGEDEDCFFEIP